MVVKKAIGNVIGKFPPLEFPLVVPLKLHEPAQKALKFLLREENKSGNSNGFIYGMINKNGEPFVATNHACHQGLTTLFKAEALFTFTPKLGGIIPKDTLDAWAEYLMTTSAWALAGVPARMDTDFAINKGYVIPNTRLPANLIANFCIATRITGEKPNEVLKWKKFVDAGIDPNLSLIFAVSIYDDGSYSGNHGAHHPLSTSQMNTSAIENFCLGRPEGGIQNFYDNPSYYPCNAVWDSKNKRRELYGTYLFDTYKAEKKKDTRMFQVSDNYELKKFDMKRWIEIGQEETVRINKLKAA